LIFQVGRNNATATRYRTLSGGIGESPSPDQSSDYVDEEDEMTVQSISKLDSALVEFQNMNKKTNLANNPKQKPEKHQTVTYQPTIHYVSFDNLAVEQLIIKNLFCSPMMKMLPKSNHPKSTEQIL
jgi:hypothetical protein